MDGLFTQPLFSGFGPSAVAPPGPPSPLHCAHGRRSGRLREQLRAEAPRLPGVYGMLDRTGKLVYVGKAKELRTRLLSYFRPKSRPPKAGRILGQTRTVVWEEQPNEFAALLRELELIRRWRPRFNVQGQPHRRRRTYLCVGRRPAPYVFLTASPPATVLACFGPLPAGEAAREAARRLNDAYGLRDCPQKQTMIFHEDGELFPEPRAAGCLRLEIGTCLGPCAAACSRKGYAERVAAARAFLEGRDDGPLDELRRAMAAASARLDYEHAAALRDRLGTLEWLRDHLGRLRTAREEHTFVYPIAGYDGSELWYLISQGRVLSCVPAPRDEATTATAHKAVTEAFARRLPPGGALAPQEIDNVLLVSAWFRKYPEEREKAREPSALGTPR